MSVAHGALVPIEAGGTWWEKPLSEVAAVEADAKRHALLHIVDHHGQRTSFLVAAGRFGPTWSKKNRLARDEAVSRIGSELL